MLTIDSVSDLMSNPLFVVAAILLFPLQYGMIIIVYRLFFHPLARVPGPKLASVTWLVEFYHNVIKDGTYYLRIAEWHEKYGPIIRITPDEVHISDPSAYDKIYHVGSRYTKDPNFYLKFSGDPASIFTTPSNVLHRQRRSALNPLFSKKAVTELEFLVKRHVDKLCSRVSSTARGESVDMHRGLRCISVDVMSDYAFGRSFALLSEPDFGASFFKTMRSLAPGFWAFRMMPTSVVRFITHLPPSISKKMDDAAGALATTRQNSYEYIVKIRDNPEELPKTHRTMFHELLYPVQDEKSGKEVKAATADELADEAITFTIAASETTGNSLEVTMLGILANESIHSRLKAELKDGFQDVHDMTMVKLEKLPFLVACVKEGLRLSHGVLGRLPRVVQEPNIEFFGYNLPIGTVVSASNWFIHRNSEIFPNPNEFNPDRWLEAGCKSLDKHLCPFSKGSRQCIGINLAYSELYLTLANLIYSFDLNIADDCKLKTVHDVEYVDYFSNFHKNPTIGLKVVKL